MCVIMERHLAYSCSLGMISINVIYSVAWIEIIIWWDRRTDVGDTERSTKVWCIIEYLELVIMCMSKKLCRDCWFITMQKQKESICHLIYWNLIHSLFNDLWIKYKPIYYVIIISRPHLETIGMSGRDVANYVHLFAIDFSTLQLIHKPLQLANRICAID